ncbi:MAG: hypothetical protein QXR45_16625, partial [Candidatus Bathyarchaeia archaeon]
QGGKSRGKELALKRTEFEIKNIILYPLSLNQYQLSMVLLFIFAYCSGDEPGNRTSVNLD